MGTVESVQDFLIKLGIKPQMHLVEISTFSINNVIVRLIPKLWTEPTKIGHIFRLHCNPLQGNYRVELLHRENPVVITGNEFTVYSFLLFWLHFVPCFNNIEIVALVAVMCTGNCQFILQGLKGCFNTL